MLDKRVIDLWLSGAVSTQLAAVQHYHPEATDAAGYFDTAEAGVYLTERQVDLQAKALSTVHQLQVPLLFDAAGVLAILQSAGILEPILVPINENTPKKQRVVHVLVPGEQIPNEALQFIDGVETVTDGNGQERVRVIPLTVMAARKNKAAELLLRTLGAFIDRTELSGPGGAPVTTADITAGMTQIEIAEIYRKAIRGEKG